MSTSWPITLCPAERAPYSWHTSAGGPSPSATPSAAPPSVTPNPGQSLPSSRSSTAVGCSARALLTRGTDMMNALFWNSGAEVTSVVSVRAYVPLSSRRTSRSSPYVTSRGFESRDFSVCACFGV